MIHVTPECDDSHNPRRARVALFRGTEVTAFGIFGWRILRSRRVRGLNFRMSPACYLMFCTAAISDAVRSRK